MTDAFAGVPRYTWPCESSHDRPFPCSLSTSLTFPPSLLVNQLYVGAGAKLNVPAAFIISIDASTGALALIDPTSLLRLESISSIPLTLICTPSALVQGDNVGPRSCYMP